MDTDRKYQAPDTDGFRLKSLNHSERQTFGFLKSEGLLNLKILLYTMQIHYYQSYPEKIYGLIKQDQS